MEDPISEKEIYEIAASDDISRVHTTEDGIEGLISKAHMYVLAISFIIGFCLMQEQ